MSVLELWLPFPPSVNRLWRAAKGRVYRSKEYLAWIEAAQWEAISQRVGKIAGPYKLSITAARPDKRKRDLDNLIKSISDLLTKIQAVEDDCLCEMLTARWVTTGDGVAVRIEKAGVE